jgi:hypothetical protein
LGRFISLEDKIADDPCNWQDISKIRRVDGQWLAQTTLRTFDFNMEQASNTSRCSEGEQLKQLARLVKTGSLKFRNGYLPDSCLYVRT